jgi:hypothetical protein
MEPLESGTASGSDKPTEISLDPRSQKTKAQQSTTTKLHRPLARATTIL